MYKYHDEKEEHLHELDGKPLIGTSTVVGVIAKPLTWWASGLAVAELGWIKKIDTREHPTEDQIFKNLEDREKASALAKDKIAHMSYEDFQKLLDSAYAAHSKSLKKSAGKGTDMHQLLEDYIKVCISVNEGAPMGSNGNGGDPVDIFSTWALKNVKRFILSEGHCYSEKLWVGGITDCVAQLLNGNFVIIDFKSSKEAYLSQFIQVAGYDIEITENGLFDADGNSIEFILGTRISAYIIFPFGADKVFPQVKTNVKELRQAFEAAVVLHKTINVNES